MDRSVTSSGRTEARSAPPAADGDARLAPAFERLASDESVRVLSLDVFDTLLFRKLHEPVDAFPLVAIRLRERGLLADGVTAELFAKLRRAAEERARALLREWGGGAEVTLEQIHQALPASLFSREVGPAELGEIECEVERELLVPDLEVLALARRARETGRTVIAVSDTYFSERQLRLFMARGPLDPAQVDRVFPSSRYGTGKASGLFSVVLEELGCRPQEVLHLGDNHFSDVVAPRRLGIQTMYFERRPPALERALSSESLQVDAPPRPEKGDHGLSALRAKVLHRVEGSRQPEGLQPFWEFGAAVAGPPFAGFAEWVHEQARRAGCSKALCLMREGQLLASLINSTAPPEEGVTAEPLWLSRQVCARAMIAEGTREELEALWIRRRLPTLREYTAALGLSLDDLPDSIAKQAARRMDDASFGHEVADAIVADAALRARVVATSRELRRRILRYVDQLRPPGEPRLLLVDLGWGATIQAVLDQLLRDAGADYDTLGLYLVTSEPAAERLLEGVESRGFLASAGLPQRAADAIMRSPEVLEQICMPDHGSQIDLTEDLRPVLAKADEFSFQSVQRAAVQQGIAAFAREWRRYREQVPNALPPLWDGARDRLLAMAARAVAAPTPGEAALFGGWMHDENFGSDRVESVVSGPAARALAYLEPAGLVDVPMTELYWPFGLAAMHDEHLAASVAAAAGGAVPWEAFSSKLETGPFEVYADLGWGFESPPKAQLPVRRNRRGLSLAKATMRGDFVKRLQLRPAADACVLRIDWISMRCRVHGRAEPVMVEISSPRDLKSLKLRGCHWIGPRVLMVPGTDPRITVDVERRAGGRVYSLYFECAFAALPLARSQARERWGRLKAAMRKVAKDWRIGAPLRLAKRAMTRLRGG
jgi:FMN phosphatase YigB (HAD superfamily)